MVLDLSYHVSEIYRIHVSEDGRGPTLFSLQFVNKLYFPCSIHVFVRRICLYCGVLCWMLKCKTHARCLRASKFNVDYIIFIHFDSEQHG